MEDTETITSLDLHFDELMPQGKIVHFGIRRQERRQKARIREPFPARIWGVGSGDLPFNMNGVLDNLSSSGLYLKALEQFDTGSEVKLLVHLFSGETSGVTASIRGRILRSELQPDGKYGLAIAISKSRFL